MASTENKIETEVQASPKASPTKKDIDIKTKAFNFYTQGKRHLLVHDIPSAINSLQEACKLLAEEYGDLAIECADPYFNYGKALLEMARMENGVLGNALDGEDQKDEVSDKVGEAIEENYNQIEKHINDKGVKEKSENHDLGETNGDSEISEDSVLPTGNEKESTSNEGEESQDEEKSDEDKSQDEDKSEDEKSVEDKSQDEEIPEGDASQMETEEGDKTEEDDEVSNLQLAWEVLELSKLIYKKRLENEEYRNTTLKLAQVHLKLGEVSMENENYAQSVEDIKECLRYQINILNTDDRCIAESHYQLGVAYSFSDDFDHSTECFRSAAKVIESRIVNLIKIKKEKDTWSEEQKRKAAETCEDPLYSEQGEIEELEKLLPDIKEKITDMEEMKNDSKEKYAKVKKAAFASMLAGTNGASTSTASNSFSPSTMEGPAKPVSNISHLVKKKEVEKRKPEGEMNGQTSKKAKLEESATNGLIKDGEEMEVEKA